MERVCPVFMTRLGVNKRVRRSCAVDNRIIVATSLNLAVNGDQHEISEHDTHR